MSRRNPMNERYTAERPDKASGATRKGASSAKPVRAAAASVRVETNKARMTRRQKLNAESNMSKEERKAERAKQREKDNIAYSATTILTEQDEKYKKYKRWWWALLIAAVVFTAISWAAMSTNFGGPVFSIVVLVLAYGSIIAALAVDFIAVRKRRNLYRDKVAAMPQRQVERIVEDHYTERGAKDAATKARKAAKKAGKSAEEQQAAYDETYAAVMKGKSVSANEAPESSKKTKKGSKGTKVTQVASSEETDGALSEADEEAAKEEARLAAARKAALDFANSRR